MSEKNRWTCDDCGREWPIVFLNCPNCNHSRELATSTVVVPNALVRFPPVLDVCCGTRMMWFDKQDGRVLFVDKRSESFRPTGVKFADKDIEVKPDIQADFKALPFPDDRFALVVFDPPHIVRASLLGNVTKYYGALPVDWKSEIRQGFKECFRVLIPFGTLIFKWCESEIPVGELLKLTPHQPLFGHRSGKAAKTHWIAFLKPNIPV